MSSIVRHSRKSDEKTGYIDSEIINATSDEDIAGQILNDPDTAPDMSEWDLEHARLVKPLQPAKE